MARALIVGCGNRGTALGRALHADGWQVRGTSRTHEGAERIAAAGLEGVVADPDRVGTVLDHVGDVAIVVWALGSATGHSAEDVNGPRLESMLERLVDTPVRGFVYEACGSVPANALEEGADLVERAEATWRLPAVVLHERADTADDWVRTAALAVSGLIAAR